MYSIGDVCVFYSFQGALWVQLGWVLMKFGAGTFVWGVWVRVPGIVDVWWLCVLLGLDIHVISDTYNMFTYA